MITQTDLKSIFNYNQDTGIFTWLNYRKGINKSMIAGDKTSDGYVVIKINNRSYYAHRLAWLYVYGSEPLEFIDHANRVKGDNRILNLREASRAENGYNRKIGSNNTSGIKGIIWCSHHKRWVARVSVNGIRKCMGYFRNINDAEIAIIEARKKHHGKFEYHVKA